MKIKSLMYVLMGTMLVTTSCSDNELEKGNDGSGTVDPVNASALVNVYSDKSGSEASLLVGDVMAVICSATGPMTMAIADFIPEAIPLWETNNNSIYFLHSSFCTGTVQ